MVIPRTALCVLSLLTPLSSGQESIADADVGEVGEIAPERGILDWSLRVQPRVWLGSAAGDLLLPGGSGELSLDTLNLDEAGLRPVLELDFQKDRWRMTLTGFFVDEESSVAAPFGGSLGGVSFAPGDRLDSSFDFLSIEALGSYKIWRYGGGEPDGWPDLESSIDLVGGVRFTSLEVEFGATRDSVGLGSSSARHLFAEPVGGARWTLGLLQRFTLETELNIGAFSTGNDNASFSFDISSQFGYRPTPNFGVLFGYRQLLSTFEDGSGADAFEYTGTTAGMYFGVELRF